MSADGARERIQNGQKMLEPRSATPQWGQMPSQSRPRSMKRFSQEGQTFRHQLMASATAMGMHHSHGDAEGREWAHHANRPTAGVQIQIIEFRVRFA